MNAEVVEIGHKPIDKTDILNSNLMQGQWDKLKSKIINNENIINDKDKPRSQTALLENQVFDLLKNVENGLTIKELSIEHPALYFKYNAAFEKFIELKKDIDVLNARITCVEYDHEELRKENQEFKKRIIFLENKIAILEFDKNKNKIITALQDLNSHEKLEIKLTQPYNSCFVNIRTSINYNNYYIDINDNTNLINNKKKYLLFQLLELKEEHIQILNKRFCKRNTYYNIIEEIIKYLQNNTKMDIDIDGDNLQIIEFRWDD